MPNATCSSAYFVTLNTIELPGHSDQNLLPIADVLLAVFFREAMQSMFEMLAIESIDRRVDHLWPFTNPMTTKQITTQLRKQPT